MSPSVEGTHTDCQNTETQALHEKHGAVGPDAAADKSGREVRDAPTKRRYESKQDAHFGAIMDVALSLREGPKQPSLFEGLSKRRP